MDIVNPPPPAYEDSQEFVLKTSTTLQASLRKINDDDDDDDVWEEWDEAAFESAHAARNHSELEAQRSTNLRETEKGFRLTQPLQIHKKSLSVEASGSAKQHPTWLEGEGFDVDGPSSSRLTTSQSSTLRKENEAPSSSHTSHHPLLPIILPNDEDDQSTLIPPPSFTEEDSSFDDLRYEEYQPVNRSSPQPSPLTSPTILPSMHTILPPPVPQPYYPYRKTPSFIGSIPALQPLPISSRAPQRVAAPEALIFSNSLQLLPSTSIPHMSFDPSIAYTKSQRRQGVPADPNFTMGLNVNKAAAFYSSAVSAQLLAPSQPVVQQSRPSSIYALGSQRSQQSSYQPRPTTFDTTPMAVTSPYNPAPTSPHWQQNSNYMSGT